MQKSEYRFSAAVPRQVRPKSPLTRQCPYASGSNEDIGCIAD